MIYPTIDEGFEILENGVIYKFGTEYTEQEMKFISYNGPESFSLGTNIEKYIGEYKTNRWTSSFVTYSPVGQHPGLTARAFLSEKNKTTGEIRIKYSEILSVRSEDIK